MRIVGKCHEIENRGDLGLRIVAGQGDSLVTSNLGSYNGRGSHFEQLTQDQADELIAEANSLEHFESETREWLRDHEEEFPDAWENDFKDYSFHFQVACYAINAAVHAYLDRNTVRSDTNERTKS